MNSPTQTDRVLGVDGGGSKTVAWIANVLPSRQSNLLELEVIGRGSAGPSNPRSVGFETAFANLAIAINMAKKHATVENSSIGVACLSLAGAGRYEEQCRLRAWSDEQGIAKRTVVFDDVEPLRLAAMYEHGMKGVSNSVSWDQSITLVVGTGSIACGTTLAESALTTAASALQVVRCGGWGYLLGDEGSGFAIGLAGLRAVCNAHDHDQALTPFHQELLHRLEMRGPTELVGFVYQTPLPRTQIAKLSEIVLAHANHDNDNEASQIATDAIRAMVRLVETIAQRLGYANESYSLAMSGGILSNHPTMVSHLLSELRLRQIAPKAYHLVREPIYGALVVAANPPFA